MMIFKTLEQYFGFNQFREGQQPVIEKVVNGQSAAAIFPTGSGKSLCYQLSAMHLPHLTLVISPLLALIKDQLDFLLSKNIPAANIDSSQTPEQSQQVMQGVSQGEWAFYPKLNACAI
jgi:ATP-dependent DNA helicase RecQ